MRLYTALFLCLIATTAEARVLKHAPECNVTMPCEGVVSSPHYTKPDRSARAVARATRAAAETAYTYGVVKPLAFVGGRLNCARAVNAHLEASGRTGTGSAAARSFASWGSPSAPVPGAVARYRCCGPSGHVAIVSHVDSDGSVWVWNPTPRGWSLRRQRVAALEYRA